MTDLLDRVLSDSPPAFAVLHRPEATGPGLVDLVVGEVSTVDSLADVPLMAGGETGAHELLVILPYRQIAERGFEAVDDGAPLLVMTVREQALIPVADLLRRLPAEPIRLLDGDFDLDDARYADLAREIVADEIGRGEGSNFVLKRAFQATIADYTPRRALSFFRSLLAREAGAYWTFCVHTGERTFVGASPERHLSLAAGTLVMNPISGTYRYPSTGPDLAQVIEFLADRKECDELYMVVDEELKMMARVCESGGRVVGPFLKEMASLAHTEYFIEGRTSRDVRDLLRETMFAPTVVGSPLESACRVVRRYEPHGRGYYSGAIALVGRDADGGRALDSSIVIRTAVIDAHGRMSIGVGATIVRHSDPCSEAAETRAKAAALLAALGAGGPRRFGDHPDVRRALRRRNDSVARFWLDRQDARLRTTAAMAGRRVLVVDAEDTFTSMIDHQLRCLGLAVTVRRFDEPYRIEEYDCVVMGPGPGDPRRHDDPKVDRLRRTVQRLLTERRPFLAVCLSHQVVSDLLGLPLQRLPAPNQGVQRQIDLFGHRVRVGFYNTFSAHCGSDIVATAGPAGAVEVARDAGTGEVYALRGNAFRSVQFHAESILSEDGVHIIRDLLTELLALPHQPHDTTQGRDHDGARVAADR